MAQCNLLAGICTCLCVLSCLTGAGFMIYFLTVDLENNAWQIRTDPNNDEFWINNKTVEVETNGIFSDSEEFRIEIYYKMSDTGVDCASVASGITVRFDCDGWSSFTCSPDLEGPFTENLQTPCDERTNGETDETWLKALTFVPRSDPDSPSIPQRGKYVVTSQIVNLTPHSTWGFDFARAILLIIVAIPAGIAACCGVVCGCVGLIAYCVANPPPEPQAAAVQMQMQMPMQQPMNAGYGQYGAYGEQPPAQGEYGAQPPMDPGYGQYGQPPAQPGQYGAQP